MIVRTAVLKGKDPLQILAEMEKIDQMGNVKLSYTYHINGNKCIKQSWYY